MLLALVSSGLEDVPSLIVANFPNPDSFYKLVLVREYAPETGFQYVARDNAPIGFYQHWSAVHSWSLFHFQRLLQLVGLAQDQALIWAGTSITLLSMLALTALVTLLVINQGSLLAAIVAAIALVANGPIRAYGQPLQITHHIFMLVPLVAAAIMLMPSENAWRRWHFAGSSSGLLLALALWISPETMPFVVVLLAARTAFRIQYATRESLWPIAASLCVGLITAWYLDPPPPSFSAWALDHVSLAWLLFGLLLSVLLVLADLMVWLRLPLIRMAIVMVVGALVSAFVWLSTVPGALAGPAGLIPPELKSLWWDRISELQPVSSTGEVIGYLAMPLVAGVMMTVYAIRRRALWMLVLALSVFVYGFLGARHTRMGAAAGLLAIICYGVALSGLTAFREPAKLHGRYRQQILALIFILFPSLQLAAVGLLMDNETLQREKNGSALRCKVADIADALNALPPGTVLAPINEGPELLWRTHHRTIAGNYHHNVSGLLDHFNAWRSVASDDQARRVMDERKVDYVLGCENVPDSMKLNQGLPTLASRVAQGTAIDWLPHHEKIGHWHLYRRH